MQPPNEGCNGRALEGFRQADRVVGELRWPAFVEDADQPPRREVFAHIDIVEQRDALTCNRGLDGQEIVLERRAVARLAIVDPLRPEPQRPVVSGRIRQQGVAQAIGRVADRPFARSRSGLATTMSSGEHSQADFRPG